MKGEAEVVEHLAFLVEPADPAREGERLPLGRGGTRRIAQRGARETEAAPRRRLSPLVLQSKKEIERLLIVRARRLRLAESGGDSAQRELAPRFLRLAAQRLPVARGLFIARGGEPRVLRAALMVQGSRFGHQPLGFHALALGGSRFRELLQAEGVHPRRDARARGKHPDLERPRYLRRDQNGFRSFAGIGTV